MDIVIVGTSNSILGREGFIKALETNHNVKRFAIGRTPLFYSLFTLMEFRSVIENCDLLILDHYINDVNFYEPKFGREYISHLDNFYLYISSLNVNILNILFPIKNIKKRNNLYIYDRVVEHSNNYNMSLIDLNLLDIPDEDYLDDVHISKQLSYFLGVMIDSELHKFKYSVSGGECKSNPYSSLKVDSLSDVIGDYCTLKNSILEVSYVSLKGSFHIDLSESKSLFAISYVRPVDTISLSGISINGKMSAFSGYGYYLETLSEPVKRRAEISTVKGYHELEALMGRETLSGEYEFCGLSELYFYDSCVKMICISSTRKKIIIDTDNILKHWKVISQRYSNKKIKDVSIDLIRDIAMSLEEIDIVAAYELMKIAYHNRKHGDLIKYKVSQYRNKVGW